MATAKANATENTKANTTLAMVKKDTVDIVANKVREFQERGELHFPANYSPENAMKAAWLTIQETTDRNNKPALSVCTKDSVANALLNMVVQGLNPAKNQCYFIVYGNRLVLQRSYFGNMYLAKLVNPEIEDIIADVVYKDDEFEYGKQRGRTVVLKHTQKLANVDKKNIIAAYCSVIYKNGTENTTIMTIDEIKQAWSQSQMRPITDNGTIKAGSTHDKFTAEMAKKTVINRACKAIINSSDDGSLLIKAYRETDDAVQEAAVEAEIAENANMIEVDIDTDTGEVIEDVVETDEAEQVEIDDLP